MLGPNSSVGPALAAVVAAAVARAEQSVPPGPRPGAMGTPSVRGAGMDGDGDVSFTSPPTAVAPTAPGTGASDRYTSEYTGGTVLGTENDDRRTPAPAVGEGAAQGEGQGSDASHSAYQRFLLTHRPSPSPPVRWVGAPG